ncbi:MAG: hypothetical protein KDD90_11360 [Sphingomonadaceae bacterium]|nr:hypothetical protein [Sphingomonadaceae bacterium]
MRNALTLLCTLLLCASCSTLDHVFPGQRLSSDQPVTGYIYAHWEYPTFSSDDRAIFDGGPFEIHKNAPDGAAQWEKIRASMWKPRLYTCFRVEGAGYIARNRPTDMWPANRQFVFTKFDKVEELPTTDECDRLRED